MLPRFLSKTDVEQLIGEPPCGCFENALFFRLKSVKYYGNDDTSGRYADVELYECELCRQLWLQYSFDYTRPRSGRWFRGLISAAHTAKITVANAAPYLENLDWYLGGGSHYDGRVYYLRGSIDDG
jgi:hypothetical protein